MAEEDPPLKQTDIIKELSLGPNTVSKLYNNTFRRIDTDTVEKLCHFFGCEISDLFELKEPVAQRRDKKPLK
jgi:putative transcriptional regulator